MKPSHAARTFVANREFTDREDARGAFQNAVVDAQPVDAYRVLHWYGVGGQGKTALTREFLRIARDETLLPGWTLATALVNFDDIRLRHTAEALLSIRLQLAEAVGNRFAAFDTAFARYFTLTNPGINIRQRHPELFRGENDLLNDLVDWSESPVGEAAKETASAVAGALVPGLNVLFKYGSRLAVKSKEWLDRRGKVVLAGLDQLNPDQIAERLPTYLGADICDLLAEKPKRRLVVLLDAYEALWRDHNLKDAFEAHRVDAWVRQLVQDSPGVLFVIMGRDKLVWPRLDPEWGEVIKADLLGGLSDEDADHFLRQVPIADEAIRCAIVVQAKGLPFHLDLQVDLFEQLSDAGTALSPAPFSGSFPEILSRFLDHLGEQERMVLRLASYPLVLTEAVMALLANTFLGGAGLVNWAALQRFSFIEPLASGGATMHLLMRQELQKREREERPKLFRDAHAALCAHHKADCVVEFASQLTQAHERAFEAAVQHAVEGDLEEWAFFFDLVPKFENSGRFAFAERMCRWGIGLTEGLGVEARHTIVVPMRIKVAELAGRQGRYREAQAEAEAIVDGLSRAADFGAEHPQTLTARGVAAEQMANQGRYAEAEAEFRAIWAIERRPEVLGEEHPQTLVARASVAQQLAKQGRYAEAEGEFRAIWAIRRRPEVLGEEHPQTLVSRFSVAQQMANQGRYADAEAEFRAIWAIQRRPEVLGEEHPQTLASRASVAQQMAQQGRYAEAEGELRAIWAIQRHPEVLGEEHPQTLVLRASVADQMANQGRYADAEAEFRAIWAIERRPEVLGEEHPQTLVSRASVAQLMAGQGRYADAEAEFRAIWAIQRRPEVLGEEHPQTLVSRFSIAEQMAGQGRYAEAEVEFRAIWAIERRPEALGEEHPDVLQTQFRLAQVLDKQGRQAEADALLEGLEARFLKAVLPGHRYVTELRAYLESCGKGG